MIKMGIEDKIGVHSRFGFIKHQVGCFWEKAQFSNYNRVYVSEDIQLMIPFENYKEVYKDLYRK